jgi:hypothetical protein
VRNNIREKYGISKKIDTPQECKAIKVIFEVDCNNSYLYNYYVKIAMNFLTRPIIENMFF